jgi:hypothetical protein
MLQVQRSEDRFNRTERSLQSVASKRQKMGKLSCIVTESVHYTMWIEGLGTIALTQMRAKTSLKDMISVTASPPSCVRQLDCDS